MQPDLKEMAWNLLVNMTYCMIWDCPMKKSIQNQFGKGVNFKLTSEFNCASQLYSFVTKLFKFHISVEFSYLKRSINK